jgi:phosphate transport system substrate-binding protein
METHVKRLTTIGAALACTFSACAFSALFGTPLAAQVRLNGAGATFPNIIYQNWMLTYNQRFDNVELNYQSIGSGGGIRQFSDKTVDFGGTDAPMTDSAIAAIQGNVLHLPTVVPSYNLPGVTAALKFTPEMLADIFLGKITSWDDARVAAANPGLTLPHLDVIVVHRSDGSGTTFVWVDYLTKVSPEWSQKVGRGTSVNWPVGLGGRGNEGVAATVRQTPGAVGYVELGYALINKMSFGQVKNRAGTFVTPSIESVTAAAAGAMAQMAPTTDFRVSITDPAGTDAYPISSFTWLLLRKSYPDAAKARELVKFVRWAITAGQAQAPRLGYAPLPKAMLPWIEARLATIGGNVTAR